MKEFTILHAYHSVIDVVDVIKEQLASYGLEIVNVSNDEESATYRIQVIK